jgi:hypothetical protein
MILSLYRACLDCVRKNLQHIEPQWLFFYYHFNCSLFHSFAELAAVPKSKFNENFMKNFVTILIKLFLFLSEQAK